MLRSLLLAGPDDCVAPAAWPDVIVGSAADLDRLADRAHAAGARLFLAAPPVGPGNPDLEIARSGLHDGVLMLFAGSGRDVARLDAMLSVAEAVHGLPAGRIRIIAPVASGAEALVDAASFIGCSARLEGLTFDPAALATSLGCAIDADAVRVGRSVAIAVARVAGVAAIHVCAGSAAEEIACREGFDAAITSDAARISSLNSTFGRQPAPGGRSSEIVLSTTA